MPWPPGLPTAVTPGSSQVIADWGGRHRRRTSTRDSLMATVARRVYGEPGSLYSRCGGVFGISAFVDQCMDRWMADTLLNDLSLIHI